MKIVVLFLAVACVLATPRISRAQETTIAKITQLPQRTSSSILDILELFGRGFVDGLSVQDKYGNITMCASGFKDLVGDVITIVEDIMESKWLQLILPIINLVADGVTYVPSCISSVSELVAIVRKVIAYNWNNILNDLLSNLYVVIPDALNLVVRLIDNKPRLAGIELGDAFYTLFLEH